MSFTLSSNLRILKIMKLTNLAITPSMKHSPKSPSLRVMARLAPPHPHPEELWDPWAGHTTFQVCFLMCKLKMGWSMAKSLPAQGPVQKGPEAVSQRGPRAGHPRLASGAWLWGIPASP